ncbi:hypothetical protein CBL_07800 [Carabus blaptoides fortunei]
MKRQVRFTALKKEQVPAGYSERDSVTGLGETVASGDVIRCDGTRWTSMYSVLASRRTTNEASLSPGTYHRGEVDASAHKERPEKGLLDERVDIEELSSKLLGCVSLCDGAFTGPPSRKVVRFKEENGDSRFWREQTTPPWPRALSHSTLMILIFVRIIDHSKQNTLDLLFDHKKTKEKQRYYDCHGNRDEHHQ